MHIAPMVLTSFAFHGPQGENFTGKCYYYTILGSLVLYFYNIRRQAAFSERHGPQDLLPLIPIAILPAIHISGYGYFISYL